MEDINDVSIYGQALEQYFDFDFALMDFHKLFNVEVVDERSIAILGGTFLEMALEHILKAFLPDNEKGIFEIFKFDGPLGTFSSKISLSFYLGLIDEVIKNDLTLVRKIRNKFAHNLYANFKDDQIKSWCNELQFHSISMMMEPPSGASQLQVFQVGVNQIILHLHGCIGMAKNEKRQIKRDLGQFKR